MSIRMVPISSIKSNPLQPRGRSDKDGAAALKPLAAAIARDGFKEAKPIWLTPDMVIIDGHRRLAAAILAGVDKVPCVVDQDGKVTDIAKGNNGTVPYSGKMRMRMWAAADPSQRAELLADIPSIDRARIKGLARIYTEDGLVTRVNHMAYISPSLLGQIQCVALLFQHCGLTPPISASKIGDWLVINKFGSNVSPIRKLGAKAIVRRLYQRIKKNEPFPPSEWGLR